MLLLEVLELLFESIAHQLLPEMPLPPNEALAEIRGGRHRRSDVA